MPAKNIIKLYIENGFYHIYNRGVEKRTIFQDEKDYKVFLSYLKSYLSPPPTRSTLLQSFTLKGLTFKGITRQPKNYHQQIILLAYCLMPNHFHLLIQQQSPTTIQSFMQSLTTRYTMYFNKSYDRVGALFQGTYKAALVNNENYLLHLSRYIHLNPAETKQNLTEAFSSYADYLHLRATSWINPKPILDYFGRSSYQEFVETSPLDNQTAIDHLALDP
jgi:putative transposase